MARGVEIEGFAAKLRLAMGRASLSSAQLAQALRVDKSVVTRWRAGTLRPGEHNLSALGALLARHVEGFSRASFDLSETDFAARLGVAAAPATPPLHDLLSPLLRGADQRAAAAAYGGLWAVLVGSPGGRGRLFGYAGRIAAVPGAAALSHDIGDLDTFLARGSMIAFGAKLYRAAQEVRRHDAVAFSVFTGVATGRAAILEGFSVARDGGPEAAPAAFPILHLRLSDRVDEASFAAARRIAGEQNVAGWETVLPEAVLARFHLPVPVPPAPSILRRSLASCWATKVEDLAEPAMADRREALAAVRRIYAPALEMAG
jgi:hypothetical protein